MPLADARPTERTLSEHQHMQTDQQPATYQGMPIVILPPWLYEAAERAGYDMRAFVREQRCEQISSLLHRIK